MPAENSPLFPRTPITPGRRSDEAWKAAPEPAPSHPSWKTLRVSHSPTGHDDDSRVHKSNCRHCTKRLDAKDLLVPLLPYPADALLVM